MYDYFARVVEVHDGDTVKVDVDLGFDAHAVVWVRLVGLNAPELHTPAGDAAAVFAKGALPVGTQVLVRSQKAGQAVHADKFGGRWLGEIMLADGTDFNAQLISSGHAVAWDGKGAKPV